MKLGVFAKSFAGDDPLTILSASRAAGFEAVQYNLSCSGIGSLPEAIPDDAVQEIRHAARATGVGIAAISATYNMTDPDPDSLAAGRRAFLAICETAGSIGSNIVTVCSGSKHPTDKWQHYPANDDPQSWTDMCKEFEIICEHATQHGVLIAVEPEPGNVVRDADRAARLFADFAGGPIRIVLDPANIIDGVAPEQQRRVIDQALDLLGD
ncbi:MAG: TIM barrel protein, partial [Pseudomonadota bacterium]|nr:TIM barrel protein [Pseudomonadota bacterium]